MPQTFAPPTIEKLAALKQELGLELHCAFAALVGRAVDATDARASRLGARGDRLHSCDAIPATRNLCFTCLRRARRRISIVCVCPNQDACSILQLFQNGARESVKTILGETGIPSRKLAVETIEFPFDMLLALANEFDTSICLDTGHILAGFSGALELFDALEKCLPRLAEIHLHDAPSFLRTQTLGYGTDHQPLGTGDLDVARLLNRLKQANFDGPIIFELTVEQALASMKVVRFALATEVTGTLPGSFQNLDLGALCGMTMTFIQKFVAQQVGNPSGMFGYFISTRLLNRRTRR